MSVDSSGLRAAVTRWAEQVAEGGARRALDTVRPGVPLGADDPLGRRAGGELRASEHDDSSGLRIVIGYSAEHASYTDEGTPAHEITGNPLLVFYWEVTDRVMFLPRVQHPGTARQGWWTDILGSEDDGYAGLVEILGEVAFVTTEYA